RGPSVAAYPCGPALRGDSPSGPGRGGSGPGRTAWRPPPGGTACQGRGAATASGRGPGSRLRSPPAAPGALACAALVATGGRGARVGLGGCLGGACPPPCLPLPSWVGPHACSAGCRRKASAVGAVTNQGHRGGIQGG